MLTYLCRFPKAEAAQVDLDFQLQEPLFYERFQIRVTANPTGNIVEVLVDDVKFLIEE